MNVQKITTVLLLGVSVVIFGSGCTRNISSKNYNQKDVDKALMIHQEEFGPPPNWEEIIPLKKAYSNALYPRNKNGVVIQQNKPLNNAEQNKLYKLTKSLESQALNLFI